MLSSAPEITASETELAIDPGSRSTGMVIARTRAKPAGSTERAVARAVAFAAAAVSPPPYSSLNRDTTSSE